MVHMKKIYTLQLRTTKKVAAEGFGVSSDCLSKIEVREDDACIVVR